MSTHPAPAPTTRPAEPAPRPVPVPPPVRPGRPRRWLVPSLVAALGLGAILYLALRQGTPTQTGSTQLVQPAPAPGGPVQVRIRLAGQTSARNFAQITVPVFRGPDSGRDLTLMRAVAPGSLVKKGDIIAELDAQSLADHIDDVADTVQQADNDVIKRKAEQGVEMATLQQNLQIAKADWDKARLDLQAAEVKTAIERQIYRLDAEEAEASYKQLLNEVAQRKAAQAAEIRILQITAERHRIHLNHHKSDFGRFKIRAPMPGLVVMSQTWRGGEMRQVQEGDQVHPGMPLMKIVDTSSMQLEARVSQADSSHFRVGQTATVGVDAFPELRFTGKVYSMGALATKGMWDTYYIRNVPVNIAIQGSDSRLIPDLSGWAYVDDSGAGSQPAAASQAALTSAPVPQRRAP